MEFNCTAKNSLNNVSILVKIFYFSLSFVRTVRKKLNKSMVLYLCYSSESKTVLNRCSKLICSNNAPYLDIDPITIDSKEKRQAQTVPTQCCQEEVLDLSTWCLYNTIFLITISVTFLALAVILCERAIVQLFFIARMSHC